MTQRLSADTQAILLLTAPLSMAARRGSAVKPLSLGEYKALVQVLRGANLTPAALLASGGAQVLREVAKTDDLYTRMCTLLDRGLLLSEAVEAWSSRSIWVASRADAEYPARWKARLGQDAPPVVYGCGSGAPLEGAAIAVVGSRDADGASLRFAEEIGRCASHIDAATISGGARGVDQAAVAAALDASGRAVAVLPDQLARAALSPAYREGLRHGRLLLLSPYDPAAPFSAGHAMQRNKLIYALADAAVVASSAFESGGSWTGAVEQLERLRYVMVYVRNGPEKGLTGLRARGARVLEAVTPEALTAAICQPPVSGQQSFAL